MVHIPAQAFPEAKKLTYDAREAIKCLAKTEAFFELIEKELNGVADELNKLEYASKLHTTKEQAKELKKVVEKKLAREKQTEKGAKKVTLKLETCLNHIIKVMRELIASLERNNDRSTIENLRKFLSDMEFHSKAIVEFLSMNSAFYHDLRSAKCGSDYNYISHRMNRELIGKHFRPLHKLLEEMETYLEPWRRKIPEQEKLLSLTDSLLTRSRNELQSMAVKIGVKRQEKLLTSLSQIIFFEPARKVIDDVGLEELVRTREIIIYKFIRQVLIKREEIAKFHVGDDIIRITYSLLKVLYYIKRIRLQNRLPLRNGNIREQTILHSLQEFVDEMKDTKVMMEFAGKRRLTGVISEYWHERFEVMLRWFRANFKEGA